MMFKNLFFISLILLSISYSYAEKADPQIELSNFKLSRQRYGQGDVAHGTIQSQMSVKNTGQQSMRNVKAKMIYMTTMGDKIRETKWQSKTTIAAGKSHLFRFRDSKLPRIETYEFHLKYTIKGKPFFHKYQSPDAVNLPVLDGGKLIPGVSKLIILAKEMQEGSRKKKPVLVLKLKNQGELESKEVSLKVDYLSSVGKDMGSYETTLKDEKIGPGKIKTLKIPMKKVVKGYSGFRVSLKNAQINSQAEKKLNGGEFSGQRIVEVAHFDFERLPDRSLKIGLDIRNGMTQDVEYAMAKISLFNAQRSKIQDVYFEVKALKAGEVRTLSQTLAKCPIVVGFASDVDLEQKGFAPSPQEKKVNAIQNHISRGQVGVSYVDYVVNRKGDLSFDAKVTNKTNGPVTEVSVTIQLIGGPSDKILMSKTGKASNVPRDGIASLSIKMPQPEGFKTYKYSFNFKK